MLPKIHSKIDFFLNNNSKLIYTIAGHQVLNQGGGEQLGQV